MSQVMVVTPVFNGADVLPRFLDTLKHTTALEDITLVAVDNHSHDASVEIIRTKCPQAHIIQNSENRGFASACNQGMQWAIERGAQYIFLANQDLSFSEPWLRPLVEALDTNPSYGAVQPLIMLYPETHLINSCGNALHYLGFGFTNCYRRAISDEHFLAYTPLAYCSGAALFLSVDVLNHIGLFDEEYFMYHEESDLCWRMRIAGYTPHLVGNSRVYHQYVFSGNTPQKFFLIERNRILNLFKNYEWKTLFLILPMLLFWECGMVVYCVLGSLTGKKTLSVSEKIRGFFYFLRPHTWGSIRRWRAKNAALRQVADREIVRLFTDTIAFQDVANPLLDSLANPITRMYWSLIKRWI